MKFVGKRQETGQDQEPQGAAVILGGGTFLYILSWSHKAEAIKLMSGKRTA